MQWIHSLLSDFWMFFNRSALQKTLTIHWLSNRSHVAGIMPFAFPRNCANTYSLKSPSSTPVISMFVASVSVFPASVAASGHSFQWCPFFWHLKHVIWALDRLLFLPTFVNIVLEPSVSSPWFVNTTPSDPAPVILIMFLGPCFQLVSLLYTSPKCFGYRSCRCRYEFLRSSMSFHNLPQSTPSRKHTTIY